jgi:hypothetical protein
MEHHYFACACQSPEHALVFTTDDGDVLATVHLSHSPWHTRIWKAVRYAFGYHCQYGHFDSFILRNDDRARLIFLLTPTTTEEE